MNYYLGLDLSLTGTGVVVLEDSGRVVFSETIKTKVFGMERLDEIRTSVLKILGEYRPKLTVIENYAMGVGPGQSFSIGELGGVIKLLLYKEGRSYLLVPPTRLKKYICGKGVAEKDMILLSVYKNFGFDASDNNTADAFGLAHIAYTIGQNLDSKNQYQREVIESILNPEDSKKKNKKEESKLTRRHPSVKKA